MQFSSNALLRGGLAVVLAGLMAAGASAEVRDYNLKIGTTLPDDHPITQGAHKFAELVQAKSSDHMKIKVYSSATLGNELQQQSALQGARRTFRSAPRRPWWA